MWPTGMDQPDLVIGLFIKPRSLFGYCVKHMHNQLSLVQEELLNATSEPLPWQGPEI